MKWKPLGFSALQKKARLLQQIRAFFMRQDVLEVQTPLLSKFGTTDPSIESVKAVARGQEQYLQTSPEFFMKRLLASGSGSIFQICPAFRDEEQGTHHLTEFTLLEWYMEGWDYSQLMQQIELLIADIAAEPVDITTLSYADLFIQYVGFDPLNIDTQALKERVPEHLRDLDHDALLDYFISIEIMPKLADSKWLFVKDYPAQQASLAKISEHNPQVAERFELFYNGLEIANGFSELQDAQEQQARFIADNKKRQAHAQQTVAIDETLIAALEHGLPRCAGVAIGIERLLMVLYQLDDIQQVGLN